MEAQYLTDFSETIRRANEEIQKYGQVTAETAEQLGRQQQVQAALIKKSQATSIIFGSLGSAAADLTKSLYNGATGAQSFANSLSIVTEASGELITVLSVFMKNPVWRAVVFGLGQLTKFFGVFFKETSKVSDKFYDSMYELSNVGLMTSGGMERFSANLINLNYGIEEVDKMVSLLKSNAQGLAAFGGTASKGAQRLGEFQERLRTTDSEINTGLRRMFGTQDAVNKRLAVYVTQQSQLGRQTEVSSKQFFEMAMASDALTKAFGIQLEQLDEAIKQGRKDTRLRALQVQLEAEGLGGLFNKIESQLAAGTAMGYKEISDQVLALITQDVDSEEFQKAYRVLSRAGVDATQVRQRILNQETEVANVITEIAKGTKGAITNFGTLAQRAPKIFEEKFGQAASGLDLGAQGDLSKKIKDSAKEIEDQTKNIGRSGEAQIKLRQDNEKSRNTLQSLTKDGIQPATDALKKLAGWAQAVIGNRKSNFDKSATGQPETSTGGATGGATGRSATGQPETSTGGATGRSGGETPSAAVSGDLKSKIMQLESGGRNIGTGLGGGTSSAFGLYQITRTTFNSLSRQAKEGDALYGKTFEQMREDVNLQSAAMDALLAANQAQLAKAQVSTKDAAMYMAHVLGGGTATKILKAANDVNIDDVVMPIAKANNPGLFKGVRTVGDIKASFDRVTGGGGYQYGGIASGPKSGYTALLHGLEAIVPLANNRTIPVELRDKTFNNFTPDMMFDKDFVNINESLNRQSLVLEQQLRKSEDMIRVLNRFASSDQMTVMIDKLQNISDKMNTSNDINSRILQVQM